MTFKASSSTSLLNLTTLTECDAVPGSYFEHDPSNYTAEQLKRWLKCRGLKQTGKRQVLVQRVSDCIKSGNHRSLDVSIDGGKWLAAKIMGTNASPQSTVPKTDSKNKQGIATGNTPVLPVPADWNKFQSKDIPPYFKYGHIYHYSLESLKDVTPVDDDGDNAIDHMTDKPLKNARKYVDSGFVHDITDAKSKDYYFIRAHVWLPHNVKLEWRSYSRFL